jgi:hypothetical protein
MNHRALAAAVAMLPLLACEPKSIVPPKPLVVEARPVVLAPPKAASSGAVAPVAPAPPVDSAPSVSSATVDAGPPEDPGPIVLSLREWKLNSFSDVTITITAKGYAFFDESGGGKYQSKVTPEGLEAFRVALLKANLCGGKFGGNGLWGIEIESKLPGTRCSANVTETDGVKSPRARAIKAAFHELEYNACHGPCPDLSRGVGF